MAYSNSADHRPGRNNFGRRPFGRPAGDRQMFKAVCSECGKECQVPFMPSGEKPVFCSNCFAQKRGSLDTRRFSDGPRPTPTPTTNTDQFVSLNAKLDKILELLTPKSTPAPVAAPAPKPKPVVEKKKKAPKKA